jgi:hypothetical protein
VRQAAPDAREAAKGTHLGAHAVREAAGFARRDLARGNSVPNRLHRPLQIRCCAQLFDADAEPLG